MTEICDYLGVCKALVYRTLKRSRAGEPLDQRNPSKRARIRGPQLQSIRSFIACDETLYLAELQYKLEVVHHAKYPLSLICRALQLLGLRRKKVRNTTATEHQPQSARTHSLGRLHSVTAEQSSATRPSAWSTHAMSARTSRWPSLCSLTRPAT